MSHWNWVIVVRNKGHGSSMKLTATTTDLLILSRNSSLGRFKKIRLNIRWPSQCHVLILLTQRLLQRNFSLSFINWCNESVSRTQHIWRPAACTIKDELYRRRYLIGLCFDWAECCPIIFIYTCIKSRQCLLWYIAWAMLWRHRVLEKSCLNTGWKWTSLRLDGNFFLNVRLTICELDGGEHNFLLTFIHRVKWTQKTFLKRIDQELVYPQPSKERKESL